MMEMKSDLMDTVEYETQKWEWMLFKRCQRAVQRATLTNQSPLMQEKLRIILNNSCIGSTTHVLNN